MPAGPAPTMTTRPGCPVMMVSSQPATRPARAAGRSARSEKARLNEKVQQRGRLPLGLPACCHHSPRNSRPGPGADGAKNQARLLILFYIEGCNQVRNRFLANARQGSAGDRAQRLRLLLEKEDESWDRRPGPGAHFGQDGDDPTPK